MFYIPTGAACKRNHLKETSLASPMLILLSSLKDAFKRANSCLEWGRTKNSSVHFDSPKQQSNQSLFLRCLLFFTFFFIAARIIS